MFSVVLPWTGIRTDAEPKLPRVDREGFSLKTPLSNLNAWDGA